MASKHFHYQTSAASRLLICIVIIALTANLSLSVNAIQCHQCNSHLDEDCIDLRLNTPRQQRDDQYLSECVGEVGAKAYCRKTETTIEVNGEHRIVRSCGWREPDLRKNNQSCIESDSEGFKEIVCVCFEDGCNAAPSLNKDIRSLAGVVVLVAMAIKIYI